MLIGTTKIGNRGQLVIPIEIRKKLKLTPGVKFIVSVKGNVVIIKPVWKL